DAATLVPPPESELLPDCFSLFSLDLLKLLSEFCEGPVLLDDPLLLPTKSDCALVSWSESRALSLLPSLSLSSFVSEEAPLTLALVSATARITDVDSTFTSCAPVK